MHKMTQPKIYTRGNTLWVRFSLDGEVIKRSLNLEDNKVNRKLCLTQIIPQMILKINTGEFFHNDKQKVPTVGEFAKISFEVHKSTRKAITQQRYIRLYELHIKPYFANVRLDALKASALAKWQNELLQKMTSKSLKGVRTIFYTLLEDAMRDEIILRNPFAIVRSPTLEEVREKKPFSVEEIAKILDAIPDNLKAFFAIGFFTGMRTGEIIALKWSDIKLDEKIIEVRRSRRQGIEGKPKTKTSIRDIEILDPLIPYLKNHKKLSRNEAEYVFETYQNLPYNTCDKISAWYWKPTLKKLGIPYRNLYQMRHTFASQMISNGEDILWVSSMLGHKDSSMTLQKYARHIKQTQRKRASFLDEVF